MFKQAKFAFFAQTRGQCWKKYRNGFLFENL